MNRHSLGVRMTDITLTPFHFMVNNLMWMAVGMVVVVMLIAIAKDNF